MTRSGYCAMNATFQQIIKLCNKFPGSIETKSIAAINASCQQSQQIKFHNWKTFSNNISTKKFLQRSCFKRSFCTGNTKTKPRHNSTFPPGSSQNVDIDQIAEQIKSDCSNVLVMAGAGLSTPSGIPDFRSPENV